MKITVPPTINRKKSQDGVAVIVMLALLALVLAFIFANLRVLSNLRGELKIIEQKQIHRLNHLPINTPPASAATPAARSRAGQIAQSLPE